MLHREQHNSLLLLMLSLSHNRVAASDLRQYMHKKYAQMLYAEIDDCSVQIAHVAVYLRQIADAQIPMTRFQKVQLIRLFLRGRDVVRGALHHHPPLNAAHAVEHRIERIGECLPQLPPELVAKVVDYDLDNLVRHHSATFPAFLKDSLQQSWHAFSEVRRRQKWMDSLTNWEYLHELLDTLLHDLRHIVRDWSGYTMDMESEIFVQCYGASVR